MQIQKDEVREKILEVAEKEFFIKGFSGAPKVFEFEMLLSRPFIILMRGCAHTKYDCYSKNFYDMIKIHIREHLGKEDELMEKIISESLLAALLSIASSKSSLEEKKRALLQYIEIMMLGILVSQKEDKD